MSSEGAFQIDVGKPFVPKNLTPGPNFFVVGAMKAGTTSLWKYISQHPDIFACPIKEPVYFVWATLDDPDQLQVFGPNGLTSARAWQLIRTQKQ